MAIAQSLPDIHHDFMQNCPVCGRSNRIVVQGVYVVGNKADRHPDMGYSFCNCLDIFYTNEENVTKPASYEPGTDGVITLPDPYFAWPNPYEFLGWDVRRYQILWNMDDFVEFIKHRYIIESYYRDMDVQSLTPQTFHIKVKINAPTS